MLNQVIIVGEVDDVSDEQVIRVVVDGIFVEVYMSEDLFLQLPDNVEGIIGVKGHLENTPAGNLMVIADKISLLGELTQPRGDA